MISGTLEALGPPVLIRERAFEQIWDAIISGRLAPGTRLIERELCDAMGISRASVREVLRRLEAERLVIVEPRKGPTVVRLTPEQAAEIYEIRAMLESLVIRRFTEKAGAADIAALEAIFVEVKRAAAGEAVTEIVALMHRFNDLLLAVAGHTIARDMLSHLDARISWLRVKAMAVPGRLQTSIDEISAVLDAMKKGDAKEAAALIERSVFNARDAAMEQISSSVDPAQHARNSSKLRR